VVYGPQGLMNTSKEASPEFLAALDEVRRTPLDDPRYPQVLQHAVELGVEMSPSFSLGTSPRIAVRNPRVSPLPHFLSQYRWEGVTVAAPGSRA
jgi:peptide/nickel transport system substrate-binding protein